METNPRSEPGSGDPTVRDRREALGNPAYGEIRNPLCNRKSRNGHSPPKVLCAQFLSRHLQIGPSGCFPTEFVRQARSGTPGVLTFPKERTSGFRSGAFTNHAWEHIQESRITHRKRDSLSSR